MVHSQSAIAKSPKEEITVETLAPFPPAQLTKPAEVCAPLLLGHYLVCAEPNGKYTGGRIVETEAYGENDEANHAYNGKTPRNSPMFLPGGNTYVYRSYGIHWCFNIVTGKANIGEAVLIRAIEPLWGIQTMMQRRSTQNIRNLARGPGNLTQALGITKNDTGKPFVFYNPFSSQNYPQNSEANHINNKSNNVPAPQRHIYLLLSAQLLPSSSISATSRTGVSRNAQVLLRFIIAGNKYVSPHKPFKQKGK